jgi:microcystin degradation protein MlrC
VPVAACSFSISQFHLPQAAQKAGLDLHAHLTDAMLENTDICIACKENPHSDVVECGMRAAQLTLQVLKGDLRPVVISARVPMILPGAGETASGPLGEIHHRARELAARTSGIVEISTYNVFRYADDYNIGQVVTIITDGTASLASEVAKDLAWAFWDNRERFADDLFEIRDAFEIVRSQPANRRMSRPTWATGSWPGRPVTARFCWRRCWTISQSLEVP